MVVPWDYWLKEDQRSNPVVFVDHIQLPENTIFPTEQSMLKVFDTQEFRKGSGRLTTWGRETDENDNFILKNSAHWIAVRNGTPLHVDPKYPRYSHHLKIRCDDNITVRGLDKKETPLFRGTFYILDTHSPHQVCNNNKHDVWNVAVSIDSDNILDVGETLRSCLTFLETSKFI